MKPTLQNPSLPMAANPQKVAHPQMARTNGPLSGSPHPHRPPIGKWSGMSHPTIAALLRKESTLQDELDDRQQSIADSAEQDQTSPYAWPAFQAWLLKLKIRLYGFCPPKPAKPARPSSSNHLGARLHLRWIRTLETLPLFGRPNSYICGDSYNGVAMRPNVSTTIQRTIRSDIGPGGLDPQDL